MCGGSDEPAAPDPWATAEAQYTFNKRAIEDSLKYGAIDQTGPFGSTTYVKDASGRPVSQKVTLSPGVQEWLDGQFGLSKGLSDAATNQLQNLPRDKWSSPFAEQSYDKTSYASPYQGVSIAPTGSYDDIAKASYDRQLGLLDPQFQEAENNLAITLANRGIPVGSEIWNNEMDRYQRQKEASLTGAANQATLDAVSAQNQQFGQNLQTAQFGSGENARGVTDAQFAAQFGAGQDQFDATYGSNENQRAIAASLAERQQPYQELAAYMGTNPNFQTPSFQQTPWMQAAAPDYTGTVNNNYNQAMNQYNQKQASQSQAMAGIGSAAMSMMMLSDEDAKTDRTPADGRNILLAFRDMPVDDYSYRDEARAMMDLPEHRTGTMAQDWAEHFGGDGHMIDMGDAIGKLMAAVKELDKRTAKGA